MYKPPVFTGGYDFCLWYCLAFFCKKGIQKKIQHLLYLKK
nr:MAG TPA: hypothetical protein [Caudoviricetes sp.]